MEQLYNYLPRELVTFHLGYPIFFTYRTVSASH